MKILVIGSGLMGTNFIKHALSFHEVIATYNKNFPLFKDAKLIKLDITNKKNCGKIIKKIKPDCVLLTAALTNVDLCEKKKNLAYRINVDGTKNICIETEKFNAKMIFISTDYVFDGKKGDYREIDQTNPINYYGYTKLLAENIVSNYVDDWVIARTSVLYGYNPIKLNFVTWVIDELKNNRLIKVVKEQYTTPTFIGNISNMILKIIEKNEKGIFHTAGSERINRYDFALKIADIFELNKKLVRPTDYSNIKWVAERPMDSSLNITKISKIVDSLNVKEGLIRMKEENQ